MNVEVNHGCTLKCSATWTKMHSITNKFDGECGITKTSLKNNQDG